jgi:hypothetical protein
VITPFVALVVFLSHPVLLHVQPVPARRAEALCGALMALAVWLQLAPRALGSRRMALLPALVTLAAITAKETAFVLPLLVFVAVALASPRPAWRARVAHAARAAVPHVAVLVLMLGVRLAVLGALGGHRAPAVGFADALHFGGIVLESLAAPQPPEMRGAWLLVASASAAIAVAAFGAGARMRRAGGLGVAWIVLTAAPAYAAGTWISAYYSFLPLMGWAMLLGAGIEELLARSRRGRRAARAAAATALVVLAVPLLWQARYSPLVHSYDEWSRATVLQREFLDALRERIAATGPGSIVHAPPLPLQAPPARSGPRILGAAILTDYSVQAWADLVLPERKVRVRFARGVVAGPAPDEVLVLLTELHGG